MKSKTSADYQRAFRERMREQGLVKKEVWIRPEFSNRLTATEKNFRLRPTDNTNRGNENNTPGSIFPYWNSESLYQALDQEPLFSGEHATIELIEGITPVIFITMHRHGDLALFLTIAGNQIVVESTLCNKTEVTNTPAFNEAILKTHKYFPLSTIGLESALHGDGGNYYFMFGSLSASSILQNVILEIETLANNVLQATEAFAEFFTFEIGGLA